jgi:hypothetical protein
MDPRFTDTDGDKSLEATVDTTEEALTTDLGTRDQEEAVEGAEEEVVKGVPDLDTLKEAVS